MKNMLLTFLLCTLPFTLWAEPGHQHTVTLSATASQSIKNDTAIIHFAAQAQGQTPAEVIASINQQMQQALEALEDNKQIQLQTGTYSVYPVYEKNRLIMWRGRQTLSLQTKNIKELPDILAEVQEILPYQSILFTVSQTKQQQIINTLITKAIQNLKERARLAMKSFGAKQALPLTTNIQTHPNSYLPIYRTLAAKDSAPGIKAGQSKINVSVSGQFLFLYQ